MSNTFARVTALWMGGLFLSLGPSIASAQSRFFSGFILFETTTGANEPPTILAVFSKRNQHPGGATVEIETHLEGSPPSKLVFARAADKNTLATSDGSGFLMPDAVSSTKQSGQSTAFKIIAGETHSFLGKERTLGKRIVGSGLLKAKDNKSHDFNVRYELHEMSSEAEFKAGLSSLGDGNDAVSFELDLLADALRLEDSSAELCVFKEANPIGAPLYAATRVAVLPAAQSLLFERVGKSGVETYFLKRVGRSFFFEAIDLPKYSRAGVELVTGPERQPRTWKASFIGKNPALSWSEEITLDATACERKLTIGSSAQTSSVQRGRRPRRSRAYYAVKDLATGEAMLDKSIESKRKLAGARNFYCSGRMPHINVTTKSTEFSLQLFTLTFVPTEKRVYFGYINTGFYARFMVFQQVADGSFVNEDPRPSDIRRLALRGGNGPVWTENDLIVDFSGDETATLAHIVNGSIVFNGKSCRSEMVIVRKGIPGRYIGIMPEGSTKAIDFPSFAREVLFDFLAQ